ncbi:MAG: hypothetical protein A2W19_15665 [Spirochaetes bacterium RBG_16_49_21]|nr:MAG: hypothetical protein A2W19_15665 [Spirochaetes bacterium RBG_16_49_21]
MKKIILIILIFVTSLVSLVCYRGDLYDKVAGIPLDSVISPVSQDKKIYIFPDPTIRQGNLGGRSGANSLCNNLVYGLAPTHPFLNGLTVRAFISDSTYNISALVPSDYNVAPVYGVTSANVETLISNTWNDLWVGIGTILINDLSTATGASDNWWSGSTQYGFRSANYCNDWNDNSSYQGTIGDIGSTDANWIDTGTPFGCNNQQTLMCVAY